MDFEYTDPSTGKTYYYSIDGESSINLTDLLVVLGIKSEDEAAKFVAEEVTNVEFSDPELVKVTRKGKTLGLFGKADWLLESLKPFDTEETLTISLKDGGEIVVKVTDDQTTGVWDLADTNNTEFLHVSADSSVTENDQERDAAFKLTFTYSLKEEVVKAMDEYTGTPITLVYDISETLNETPLKETIKCRGVIIQGTSRIGTYRAEGGKVYIEIIDPSYLDGRTSLQGFFEMTVQTDETQLGSKDKYTYEFPGTTDVVPIKYKKKVTETSKTLADSPDADGNYTLHYTANVHVTTDLNTLTFNDTLGGLQNLDASSVKVNGQSVTVSQSGKSFSFEVGAALGTSGVAKGNYTVTYDTKLTAEQLKQMSGDKTTETNVVTWNANGSEEFDGGKTEKTYEKPHEPVPVTKLITDGKTTHNPGDTISYQITYGDSNTDLAGFEIYDSMTDLQTLQGDISISYNGTSITMPSSAITPGDNSYSTNMVQLFNYKFLDNEQGKGPVVVTYTTKVIDADTAKANGIYDTKELSNLAQEKRYNTSDTVKTNVPFEKEKVVDVSKTVQAAPTDGEGNWLPGSTISYTLTVGNADTDMSGVHIWDNMTDLQILQGAVKIKVGGNTMNLDEYIANATTYVDDQQYSLNDVKVFDFIMPKNCGKGPVVITYTTKVISEEVAKDNGIYGEASIKNTGHGGPGSDGTEGTGIFGEYPISKEVTNKDTGADVNHQKVQMGDIVHYKMTLGDSSINLKDAIIKDEMTDVQKVISAIKITKANGESFTMPPSSGQWQQNGYEWGYWDDGKYDASKTVRVFEYKLPADIGYGPITIEYDAQIISEEEANNSGINGDQKAYNTFSHNDKKAGTDITIEFPKVVKHEPKVRKEFNDKWDIPNSIVYWDIIVEKEDDSAYPLENVTVREHLTSGDMYYKNPATGVWWQAIGADYAKYFDVAHAKVTTNDGTELTPGVDYFVNKDTAAFTFPILTERVNIELPFHCPTTISNEFEMKNIVVVNDEKPSQAIAKYNTNKVEITKDGTYSDKDRLFTWVVWLNPSKQEYADADPIQILFKDKIPEGLVLCNYDTKQPGNPSIRVYYSNEGFGQTMPVTINGNNEIEPIDVAGHKIHGDKEVGLNKDSIKITYYTYMTDEEWNNLTSSAAGKKTYENRVDVTTSKGDEFNASGKVTVTENDYLVKEDITKEEGGIVVEDIEGFEESIPSKNISYSVKINPNGYVLNYGNPLSLTDFISTNMDLDPGSVEIKPLTEGGSVPEGIQISYNDDSRLLKIENIPDKTALLLTYTCFARAQGEDDFVNTATLIGGGSHSATITDRHNVQTNNAGFAVDGIEFNLHKIDENNISKDLSDAYFQLYECDLAIGSLNDKDQQYWDDLLEKMNRITAGQGTEAEIAEIKDQFKITSYTPVGSPKFTGNNGKVYWSSLSEHKLYAWKEVTAPEGYTGNTDYHYFVGYQHIDVNAGGTYPLLPEDEQLRRKHAAWALDDATQLANGIRVQSLANLTTWTATNIEAKYTWISATKEWEGDSDNIFETRPTDGIHLQLVRINPDGTTKNVGSKVAINADEKGNWPTYLWDKLPAEDGNGNKYKYKIVEDKVEDYSTEYSDASEGIEMGEITVINKMIPKSTNIHVEKRFDQDGDDKPDGIKVTLKVIRTDLDGISSEPEETGYEAVLSNSNDWKWCFEKLPTKEIGTDGKAYFLTYTVVEDLAAIESQGFKYTVTYSDNGEGVLETTEEEPLLITNKAPRNGSLKINKKVTVNGVDPTTDTYPLVNGKYTFTIEKKDDTEFVPRSIELVINGNNIAESPEITDLPAGTYVITEAPVSGTELVGATIDGASTSISSNSVEVTVVAGKVGEASPIVEFTNSATKIEFEKIWKKNESTIKWPENTSIEVTVQGGANTYTYEISRTDLVKDKKIDGKPDGAPQLTVKEATENDDTKTYIYKFEVNNLPYISDGSYKVTEKQVDKFKPPIYKNGQVDTPGGAQDGGSIINIEVESYNLPESGGFGTTPFYTIGLLLIAFAAGLYTYFNKKKLIAIHSDRRSSGTGRGKSRRRGGDGL